MRTAAQSQRNLLARTAGLELPPVATGGHISKQGSASARWALVEAAWSVVRQPGPLHAFYARIRARRGHGIAVVASARKLVCLFWFLLTRGEDYAHQQPSLTARKLRLLEIRAGAPTLKGTPTGVWATRHAMREAERRGWRATERRKDSKMAR